MGKDKSNIFQKMSIRKQMIVLVSCFLLLPLLLFTSLFSWFMVREVRRNVEVSVENSLILTEINLENLQNNMINACFTSSSNAETAEFLNPHSDKSDFEKRTFAGKIEKMVTVNMGGADIHGAIIGLNRQTFNLYDNNNNPLALEFYENPDRFRTITWSVRNVFDSIGTPFIVCTCPIYKKDTAVVTGISVAAISQRDFQAIINRSRNYDTYEAMIVDDHDVILSHQNENMIGKSLDEVLEERCLYFDKGISIGDAWRAVTLISYDEVFSNIDRVNRLKNIVIVLMAAGTVLGVLLISKTVSKPIVKLQNYMAEYPKNKGTLMKETISSLEADSLYDSYLHQMDTIETLIAKIESDKQKLSDLQFRTLQAQINPHFLFNTLNNIKMLSFMKGCPEAGVMIAELGRLLEVSICFNSPTVTIGEELAYVDSYVKLQNIHFEGELILDNQIPEVLFRYQIVKFTLQPILENSIKHGFQNRRKDCNIVLTAEETKEAVTIHVRDNGDGFPEGILGEIQKKLLSREETERVGLYNINERIKLSFGEEYGLRIDSVEGNCTVVSVELPKIEGDKNAEGTYR